MEGTGWRLLRDLFEVRAQAEGFQLIGDRRSFSSICRNSSMVAICNFHVKGRGWFASSVTNWSRPPRARTLPLETTLHQTSIPIVILNASNAAAVTVLADARDDALWNVYTTVIYGREGDLRSFPAAGDDVQVADTPFRVLRKRMTVEEAQAFVAGAESGVVALLGKRISYGLGQAVASFRSHGQLEPGPRSPLIGESTWGRERAATLKQLEDVELTERTLPAVAQRLALFEIQRAAAAPISRHPEKLGDLDEFYLAPVDVDTESEGESTSISLAWSAEPLDGDIRTEVTLYKDDLETVHVSFFSIGKHRIDGAFDAIVYQVSLDGIPIVRSGGYFTRFVGIAMGIDPQQTLKVGDSGKYDFTLPVQPRAVMRTGAGELPAPRPRTALRFLVDRWREGAGDSEFVYDPREPGVVECAFRDLQKLGVHENARDIYVVDPFVLSEPALRSIAAIASGREAQTRIWLLSKFEDVESPQRDAGGGAPGGDTSADASRRQQVEERFRSTAKRVQDALGVEIRVVAAKGISLHDRFLVVGRRIWHVGHSFNAIGESLSAIVEMRNFTAKAKIFAIVDEIVASHRQSESPDGH